MSNPTMWLHFAFGFLVTACLFTVAAAFLPSTKSYPSPVSFPDELNKAYEIPYSCGSKRLGPLENHDGNIFYVKTTGGRRTRHLIYSTSVDTNLLVEHSSDVLCAHGLCTMSHDDDERDHRTEHLMPAQQFLPFDIKSLVERVLSSHLGPRVVLAMAAALYGTNFPLGAIMNDALPASAATSARMVLAFAALFPFLFRLDPTLISRVILCGCCTSLGYVSQSLALVDTSPATVSFLGAATVIVCPVLECVIDGRRTGFQDAPQTWVAAALCLAGVGTLELCGPAGCDPLARVGFGDVLALIQAVGFGAGIFLSERMMRGRPDQALPVTAGLVGTTAFVSMLWCLVDGWIGRPGWEAFTLPGLFLTPSLSKVAFAVAWTGIVSTSLNFYVEVVALGRVPSAEASVLLATEPLWAALFASLFLHEAFGANDIFGGLLIVAACVANTLKPSDFHDFFSLKSTETRGNLV